MRERRESGAPENGAERDLRRCSGRGSIAGMKLCQAKDKRVRKEGVVLRVGLEAYIFELLIVMPSHTHQSC